jgi:thiol-disulfide isomerase/thioredoxin
MELKGYKLTANNFKIKNGKVFVNSNTPGMLLCWADYCGHCHRFFPTFNEIFDTVSKGYICASIESKELNESLSSALNIKGFPTIVFFDSTGMIIGQYSGDRSKNDLLDTICKVYHYCNRN